MKVVLKHMEIKKDISAVMFPTCIRSVKMKTCTYSSKTKLMFDHSILVVNI